MCSRRRPPSAAGYCYRRDSCFYLTCYKIFWTYGHAAHSVVFDPANCEAVRFASPRVAIPINVIHISVIWVYSRVVNSAKQSVDGAELGVGCVLSALATMIPPGIPFRVHVAPPSVDRLSMKSMVCESPPPEPVRR